MKNRDATTLPRWVLSLIALIPLAGVVAGAARYVKQTADATYVRRDTFAVHQQGEALIHQADSLNYAADKRDVLRILAGLDSSDKCRRGIRDYCR